VAPVVVAEVTLVLVGHERLIALRTSRRRRCCASPPSDDRLRCAAAAAASTPPESSSSRDTAAAAAGDVEEVVSGQDSCVWGRARSRVTSGWPGRPPA